MTPDNNPRHGCVLAASWLCLDGDVVDEQEGYIPLTHISLFYKTCL